MRAATLKAVGVDRPRRTLESWQMIEIDRPRDADAGARARSAASAPRSKTCARRSTIFRAMLERVAPWPTNSIARALPVPKSHASEARALLALDARRALRVPRLSLLPPQARPLARRAGARRATAASESCAGLASKPPAAHRAHRASASARRARRTCWCSPRRTLLRPCIAEAISTTSASRPSTPPASVSGEHRFLGLWTSSAYHKPPAEIPLCCGASSTR